MGYLEDIMNKWDGGGKSKTLYPDLDDSVELRIELSNICNHACIFCAHRQMQRKQREMDEALVVRLLNEGKGLGIKKLGLFINGEPFVTQKLPEYIAQAKTYGYEYVYITTNGALATEEKMKACIKAGVDSIKFSINAGSRENYKIVHQRDDYDKVIQNLKFTYKYRQEHGCKFKILSSFVVTKYTIGEIEEYYEFIKPYVDKMYFFDAECRAGQMGEEISSIKAEVKNSKLPWHKLNLQVPCKALWNSINVTCEGYLALCGSEVFNYLVVEDLNTMSLKEAWYSERMIEMRKRHLENRLEGTQCAQCLGSSLNVRVQPLNQELYEKSLDERLKMNKETNSTGIREKENNRG